MQKMTGSMTYPKKGSLNRFLFKSPLIWWRMGLGSILSHKSLGGYKMLVITSWGRRSKKPRHTMLSYVWVGGKEYVCSGWGDRSDWYQNIQINPIVTVQVGQRTYTALAHRIDGLEEFKKVTEEMFETGGDSHFESWLESFDIEFNKEDMIAKRDRLYIVGFEKRDQVGPPPLSIDLKWIWGLMALVIAGLWWLLM
ncbi:MAG: nitroreductase family deazaflavin-dependent oxidoreductase [Anaerolineales bacterium]